MKKSSLFQLFSTLALIALLGTSWAQEAPEAGTDDPNTAAESSREDISAMEQLQRARELVKRRLSELSEAQYPSLPTPPAMYPRLSGSLVRPCLAQMGGTGDDLCAQARAISRMSACVRPEDCQAYNTMRQLMGEPEIRKVPADSEIPLWRPELASAPAPESPMKEERVGTRGPRA